MMGIKGSTDLLHRVEYSCLSRIVAYAGSVSNSGESAGDSQAALGRREKTYCQLPQLLLTS